MQAGFLLRSTDMGWGCVAGCATVAAIVIVGSGEARADTDFRMSFDFENAPLVSRSVTPRIDLAGFSAFTSRAHMRVGHRSTLSAGLGLSPISMVTLLTFLVGEPTILPDPIINLQVPATFTYFVQGVGREGVYGFTGPRFMIVPVLPCANAAERCPNGRADAFGFGPAGELGLGYQFNRGAAWRASISYMHAWLAPLGNTGETRAFDGIYHGVVLSFGGITDAIK